MTYLDEFHVVEAVERLLVRAVAPRATELAVVREDEHQHLGRVHLGRGLAGRGLAAAAPSSSSCCGRIRVAVLREDGAAELGEAPAAAAVLHSHELFALCGVVPGLRVDAACGGGAEERSEPGWRVRQP